MTTSGITSWPLTALEIVTQALVELGAINSGDVPEGDELEDALTRLNGMLHTWAVKANLFRDTVATVTVTAGSPSVAAPTGARAINTVRCIASATNHRLMGEWNRDQYYMLPNRAQTSSSGPTIWYAQKSTTGITLYVWPVPSANVDLEVDYGAAVQTVTDGAETLDIPEEWQEAVILGLATRCANMFGTTRIDPRTVQRIDAQAGQAYQALLDSDRPDSYFFEPDC